MSWLTQLDRRPIIVALAGPNGAGKSTFYETHLKAAGLRFLNADLLAHELDMQAYAASHIAAALRAELLRHRESFIFETVLSDPVGDKVGFLKNASHSGYHVVLCFIGLNTPASSEQRVAMRVSQGGHDVPAEKLVARFPRTLANLAAAIPQLPSVLIFDNENLRTPFRPVVVFAQGCPIEMHKPIPSWLQPLL